METYADVTKAIKMLGSKFFQEVQGQGKMTQKTKTYEVNLVAEHEEEPVIGEEIFNVTWESNDLSEGVIDQLIQEGDEDAFVVNQFEEALIDTIQNDNEMAAFMSTYVEARKRLLEKSKSRGFWPVKGPGKGAGKAKGKQKPPFFRKRKPLAVRIAESERKLRHAIGHWKAERPQRFKNSQSGMSSTDAKPQVAATLHVVEDVDAEIDESDVIILETEQMGMHDDMQDIRAQIHECLVCSVKQELHLSKRRNYYAQVCNRMKQLVQNMTHEPSWRRNEKLVSVTPSCKKAGESPRLTEHDREPVTLASGKEHKIDEQHAMFVTSQASGVLDLGASQTVIGQQQVPEFLQSLPADVRDRVYETKAHMTFRFGNNSTVPCNRMMLVPIDKYWLKIAIVESQTPFLLSNNVCRCFGAVIDTEKEEIFFRKLQCTMPLTLSGKKLCTLNVADLVTLCPPRVTGKVTEPASEHAFAQSCKIEPEKITNPAMSEGARLSNRCEQNAKPCTVQTKIANDCSEQSHDSASFEPRACQRTRITSDSPIQVPRDKHSHVREEHACRSILESPGGRGEEESSSGAAENVIRRIAEHDNSLRIIQSWCPVPSGGARRSQVLPMVPSQMGNIQQNGTCGVHLLPADVDRKDGTGGKCELREHPGQTKDIEGHHGCWKGQWEKVGQSGPSQELARDIRRGDREWHQSSPQSARRCPDAGSKPVASSHDSGQVERVISDAGRVTDPVQTEMIEQCIQEYESFFQALGRNILADVDFDDALTTNPIWHEMQNRFETLRKKYPHRRPSMSQIDVLEIYCSSESHLTKQCLGRDLKSMRFGLKQGDLSHADGRQKLFDMLFFLRPKHAWMSPKCKAWCKWSQFNAGRSLQGAEKVLIAKTRRWDPPAVVRGCLLESGSSQSDVPLPFGTTGRFRHGWRRTNPICTCTCTESTMWFVYGRKSLSSDHQTTHAKGSSDNYNISDYGTIHEQVSTPTHTWSCKCCRKIPLQRWQSKKCVWIHRVIYTHICKSTSTHHTSQPQVWWDFNCSQFMCFWRNDRKWWECWSSSGIRSQAPSFEYQKRTATGILPRTTSCCPWWSWEGRTHTFVRWNLEGMHETGTSSRNHGCWRRSIVCYDTETLLRPSNSTDCRVQGCWPLPKATSTLECLRSSVTKVFWGLHRHNMNAIDAGDWEDGRATSVRQMCSKSPPFRVLVTIFAKSAHDSDRNVSLKRPEKESEQSQSSKRQRASDELPETVGETTNPLAKEQEIKHEVEKSTCHHGPKFLALPKGEKQWLSKIHYNLGHPNVSKLQMVLKQQGYASEIVEAVADFKCSTCHELQNPRIARPSVLSEPREFNDCVGCDAVTWTSAAGKQFTFLHFIDMATNFQQGCVVNQMDAESLFEAFQDVWLHWAGPCKQLIIDNDSALCSERFSQLAQEQNIHLRVVAAYAHWQMGKTERHGDIVQHMLMKYDHDKPIINETMFRKSLLQCLVAKNSLARAKGYTPEILVLGKSKALPGSLSDNPFSPSQFVADAETPEGLAFREQLQMRECARKAFISADNDEKLRRAFLRRQRPYRGNHSGGAFVMFWRPGRGENAGSWTGPARVIVQESEHVVWISFASRVYRVAPEHVRSLSEREPEQCLESAGRESMEIPKKVGNRGVFAYEDLASIPSSSLPVGLPTEGPPVIPENIHRMPTPESQPDAEPALSPHVPPSLDYEPSTPSESKTEQNEPIDPANIPIPVEASDDELIMEDFWVQEDDCITRVHRKPRYVAFDPSTLNDCPVPILHLHECRTTEAKFTSGEAWGNSDNWGREDSHWLKQQPWTGKTIFHVMPHAGEDLPDVQDILHVEQNQCFEMEIFFTSNDLNRLHSHPEEFVTLASNAAKRQHVEVKLKDLNEQDVMEFNAAKEKEIDQWLETATIRRIMRNRLPEENILRCRWILTWKQLDSIDAAKEGKTRKAKARLVVRGFEDPDLTELARDSPTLQRESRALILQYCASRKWTIKSFDIRTAFLRGSRRDDRVLAIDPPPEMRQRMKLKEAEVGELLKSAYGLVNAPYLWYQELRETLISLGFKICPLDPCLFSLSDEEGRIRGLLGVHVDDGLCCGDQMFVDTLKRLESKFPFGAKQEKNFKFTGIDIEQDDHWNIHLSQKDYVLAIEPISIERNRRKQEQLVVNEKERQELRGLIGSLQYAATNTRPDLAARLSFLQSTITTAKIHDLLECNRLLGEAKKYSDVKVTLSSIPVEKVRFESYSDASFATRAKQQSQKGGLFLATHSDVFQQTSAKSSPLTWYSKKIDRVVASTLAAETYALSAAVDMLDWLRLSWEWIKNASIPWKQPVDVWRMSPSSIAVIDCKSLYDVITKNTTPQCQEHRTLIEALIIKDHLQSGIKPYWAHSAAQLADALTKTMDCFRLREFLQHRSCCLHDIDEVLKARADQKSRKHWLRNEAQRQSAQADESSRDQQFNYFINFGECDLHAYLKQLAGSCCGWESFDSWLNILANWMAQEGVTVPGTSEEKSADSELEP